MAGLLSSRRASRSGEGVDLPEATHALQASQFYMLDLGEPGGGLDRFWTSVSQLIGLAVQRDEWFFLFQACLQCLRL